MKSLHLQLLGGFLARDSSGQTIAIAGSKAALMLAYLALRPGEPRSRERLIALLWSDRGEAQARGSLRQALWSLRRAFQEFEPSPVMTESGAICLNRTCFETDVAQFEALLKEGTPDSLKKAVDLYKGELLAGVRLRDAAFEDWVRGERERFHDLAVDACAKLIDCQLNAERPEDAAGTARRLLAIDPLQEAAYRALMEYYAGKNQLSLAVKQYQVCREVLRRELQMEPDAETEELLLRIRRFNAEAADRPVHDAGEAVRPLVNGEPAKTVQEKPSIAVLPFLNLSGDPEQDYFSDGITEDIITALSRLRWFLVISPHSVFAYKGKAVDIKQVGRELGVRYVLEGSVRKAAERVRISAQLVDAKNCATHWAQNYDRELTNIFELQDDITQSVTAAIEPKLVAAEGLRSQNRSASDLGAWDLVMRAMARYGRMTTKDSKAAIEMLEESLRRYPDYGPAHSLLAVALLVSGHVGWIAEGEGHWSHAELAGRAGELARRAAELDDEDPWAHLALGYLAFTERQTDEAVRQYLRALDLNPNFATAYGYLGWAVVFDGQSQEAIRYFRQALRMSPHDPLKAFFYSGTGVAHYYAQRYEEAVEWARKAIRERPEFTAAHRILCASLAQAQRIDETAVAVARLKKIQPSISISWIERHVPYTDRAMDHFLDGMRRAGIE